MQSRNNMVIFAFVAICFISMTQGFHHKLSEDKDLVLDGRTGKKVYYRDLVQEYKDAQKEQCESLKELDGCSAPFGDESYFYRGFFTPACLRHDICYRCARTYKWRRTDCDNAFQRDMEELCKSKQAIDLVPRSETSNCVSASHMYYYGVRAFGSLYHGVRAKDWCKLDCSHQGGDPFYTTRPENKIDTLTDWNKLKVESGQEDGSTSASGEDE
uniref:Toxin candidate TRINITY_DN5546_c0_g1_i1 n=1 Tax=Ceriantheomorphe brasiliensis TaxID=1048506 RepID=A0A7G7WZ22_9CNID|nr:toxin candidate TRINITY_DN5546_c0_g1_i1 [Ceriantheomorphe brasiliensis]